ncbi:unnamed protein product [Candidula unifasciata]|uniref:Uncharacterized protein n=1 Tax=Candidula unifasciata TaxID=100452 RepID=A0A8S3YT13_9EUPU|nr:unnamed protein product [Candidula unifasciata]
MLDKGQSVFLFLPKWGHGAHTKAVGLSISFKMAPRNQHGGSFKIWGKHHIPQFGNECLTFDFHLLGQHFSKLAWLSSQRPCSFSVHSQYHRCSQSVPQVFTVSATCVHSPCHRCSLFIVYSTG